MKNDAIILKPIISDFFKCLRETHGWTQEGIAERLHVSARAYTDLERQENLCSFILFLRCYSYCMSDEQLLDLMHTCSQAIREADAQNPPCA